VSNLSLTLRLRADADGLVKVLDASGKEVAEFGREGERAGKRADAGFTQARRGVQSISEQLKIARRQLLGFIGVQFGAQLGRQLIGIADQYTNLNSRIGLVTNSQREANETFDALFEVAQRSRAELGATVDLYTTLARSTADLRLSQTDLLQITETINQSFIISGASAEASRNAIIQLSQAKLLDTHS